MSRSELINWACWNLTNSIVAMREMGIRLLYKMMNIKISSTNCLARSETDGVWKRYHCELEKDHVRMMHPTAEPRDRTRRRTRKKTIWTLTCRSRTVCL